MGHKQQKLAVLFIDVSDSTGIYRRRGDRAAYQLLSGCLNRIERAVQEAGGRPIKRMGDGVLAVARLPAQALTSALRAREAVAVSQSADERLRVRAGLSYGPVVVADGDVYGDNVIIAARLVSVANSDEILLSDSICAALPVSMRGTVRTIPPVRLRGREAVSTIFQYVGCSSDATKIGTRAAGVSDRALELAYHEQSFSVDALRPHLHIGRAEDNEIVVYDERVSQRHASVELFDDRYILADRSTNGTYVQPSTGERLHLIRSQTIILGEGYIFPGSLRIPPISYAVRRRR